MRPSIVYSLFYDACSAHMAPLTSGRQLCLVYHLVHAGSDAGGARADDEAERDEAAIVREYLPKPMDDGEIADAAQSVVSELEATGLKDMGRCMGELKSRYAGRMDFAKAGAKVKTLLASA